MKVLFDAKLLNDRARFFGSRIYLDSIIQQLGDRIDFIPFPKYRLSARFGESAVVRGIDSVTTLLRSGALRLPRDAVFWGPSGHAPFGLSRCNSVITIHDLMLFDSSRANLRTILLRKWVATSTKVAKYIITDTEVVADRIRARFADQSRKVVVIPIGVDHIASEVRMETDPAEPLDVPSTFILMLGAHHPRKNLAFSLALAQRIRDVGISLVVTGSGRRYVNENVIALGDVPAEQKNALIRRALAVVYPSTDEGFGLPVFEAIFRGTPIICNDLPVYGDFSEPGIHRLPLVLDTWEAKIRAILAQGRMRPEEVVRALSACERYSWAKAAEQHYRVFRDAAKG